ncbi:PREDICTED: probable inactive histone-lysine N-methyltransferase SUVR2 [Tarenaya hassleriana]|uniref:probable inactive histone-lysine N-methyltransferase SUVR2 n=1 Tax=Tarenaya hassleriana TaxID=28532 RepID=UPI00053C2159|nr:PREDICTED: probable inactive histone-lysine N-methyltransferase SUVR2 [Tarenaya hassleriana]XP_010522545.1 PREDICTED: probable inactive histone-lysine N-methyltransferase SUVR2 [Tarenaya hassleriana]XP_010522546.1 PREDICTED: probable inactive histone-lysine N-methyltransferase SUVR2 [Tarenaya hassleriana]XP_010522547.1 PREDICTED: probable inactive histone-lysine N-methyltransferase SUVR2 [Tarenaya hassleriana]
MPPNPNIKRAFEAMKCLGFEEKTVRPVLKNLLKLYDKNWELISEDNFRALAEAILDNQETEVIQEKKGKKKKFEEEDSWGEEVHGTNKKPPVSEEDGENDLAEPEHPLKRQRRRAGDSAQTLNGSPSPSIEAPLLNERKAENRENRPSSLPTQLKVDVPATTCPLIIPKDEPFTDDMPLSVIHPDTFDKGSASYALKMSGNADDAPPPEHYRESEVNANNSSSSAIEKSTGHKLDVVAEEASAVELASSPLGEVKINLSFSPTTGDFRQPSLDDLWRAMEEKCLRSYKILDPNFSVRNFMSDMCGCYLELAKNSANQSPEKLPYITPNLDILKKSSARNLVFSSGTKESICQMGGVENGEVGIADHSESRGLVVVPECQISADGWRSINSFSDITQGEETVEIPWANEVNNELLPSFRYSAQSLVFRDASVKFTLSNIKDNECCFSCFGDCLASPMLCRCAVADSGFAYTSDGVLKEDFLEDCISVIRDSRYQCLQICKECPLEKAKKGEVLDPCKGHLKRKVIKECWSKCGCNANCGNRVVQRRIHNQLQVFFTPNGKGWGLRTLEKLPKGAFVCEFTGEILTISEMYQRVSKKHESTVILDAYWGSDSENTFGDDKALCLDGMQYGNVARFINHRCMDANLIEVPVHVESPDHHYYHLAFFTTREIHAMEELTWDYGIEFSDGNCLMKTFKCLCGSKFCRDMKRANEAKNVVNTP